MKIDIDQFNRKMPYPEPSEAFFQKIQDNVVAKIAGEKSVIKKKETKIFSLNFKWMAAASVVLIAGIFAFFGLQNNPKTEIANQTNIIDSVYETEPVTKPLIADNSVTVKPLQEIKKNQNNKYSIEAAHISKINDNSSLKSNIDIQDYSEGRNNRSETAVDKVLVAFTADQIKDIDKNSEQDIYLDLYN